MFNLLMVMLSFFNFQSAGDVIVSHKTDKSVIAAGQSVTIAFSFQLPAQSHMNAEPLPKIELKKNSLFSLKGDVIIKKFNEDLLDDKEGVKAELIPTGKAKKGKNKISGTITYFVCSDKDHTCNMYTYDFSSNIEIK